MEPERDISINSIFLSTRLLHAAGCGEKNIQALTSVMDLERVTVQCDLLEIDAWRKIAVESNVIKTLDFKWDSKGGFQ